MISREARSGMNLPMRMFHVVFFHVLENRRLNPGCRKSDSSHFHCLSWGSSADCRNRKYTRWHSPREPSGGNELGWAAETTQGCSQKPPRDSRHHARHQQPACQPAKPATGVILSSKRHGPANYSQTCTHEATAVFCTCAAEVLWNGAIFSSQAWPIWRRGWIGFILMLWLLLFFFSMKNIFSESPFTPIE